LLFVFYPFGCMFGIIFSIMSSFLVWLLKRSHSLQLGHVVR
jgi:H+/Cl- antiporter ClcA